MGVADAFTAILDEIAAAKAAVPHPIRGTVAHADPLLVVLDDDPEGEPREVTDDAAGVWAVDDVVWLELRGTDLVVTTAPTSMARLREDADDLRTTVDQHTLYNAELADFVTGQVAFAEAASERLDALPGQLAEKQAAIDAAAGEAALGRSEAQAAMAKATTVEGVAASAVSAAAAAQSTANTAVSNAAAAQAKANTAAADLLTLAGKTGRVIRSTTAPTSADDKSVNNLWLNTSNGQLSQWTGSAWSLITDSRLTAAANTADAAANAAANAQTSANNATSLANAAQATANTAVSNAAAANSAALSAGSAAATAQSKADLAHANAATAQGTADTAVSNAATAQTAATNAATAAASAAGIASGKADVLIQATAPAAEYRKTTTLWIDTSSSANTPKRWTTGTTWVAVTDKAATDAAAAAVAAQTTANNAATAAAAAQSTANNAASAAVAAQGAADAAMAHSLGVLSVANAANNLAATADGRVTVATANPTSADAAGKPIGAIWSVRSGGVELRRYVLTAATTWTQVRSGQDMIGENAVGQAQIMDLAVGTGQIADLAVTDAKLGSASVAKLVVTGGATIPVAVIDTLVGQDAFMRRMAANRLIVTPDNLVQDPYYDQAGAIWNCGQAGTTIGAAHGWSDAWAMPGRAYSMRLNQRTAGTANMALYHPNVRDVTARVRVTPGEKISCKTWWWVDGPLPAQAAGQTASTQVYFYNAAGLPLSENSNISSGNRVRIMDIVPGKMFETGGVITVPAGAAWALPIPSFYFSSGTIPTTAAVFVGGVSIQRLVGSVLIEDGAVTAPKIVASSELSAKVAEFLDVSAERVFVGGRPILDEVGEQIGDLSASTASSLADGLDALNAAAADRLDSAIAGVTGQLDQLDTWRESLDNYVLIDGGGIFIGNRTDDFRVNINSSRMSFIEGDKEVAYVSNQALFIGDATITGTLTQGGFYWETQTGGRLDFKWGGVSS